MQRSPYRPPGDSPAPGRPPRIISAAPATRVQLPVTRPLTPNEFNTALVHLYRGEVSRANTWRQRLDGTTNWAVLTTGATLSFAFSSPTNTPVMILFNSLLIAFFLFIEARRYRFYDLWRARVRIMETEFFAEMLAPQLNEPEGEHWRELLASDLVNPQFNITTLDAMSRRLRRNYMWIFGVLGLSWFVKVGIHPTVARSFGEFYARAAVGPLPSWFILLFGAVFNLLLLALAYAMPQVTEAGGEVAAREAVRDTMGSGIGPEQPPEH
ncbi:MAG TPA: DUF2270 domain-containing protein [Herpetosiphonaceae bacterium]